MLTDAHDSMALLHKLLFVPNVFRSPTTIKARFALVQATLLEMIGVRHNMKA
jgi:hypothetical protein